MPSRMRAWGLALAASVLATAGARADVVFDFEEFEGNTDDDAGDYAVLGFESEDVFAVIYRTSGERFSVWDSKGADVPDSWGEKHLSPWFNFFIDDYLVMSFSEPMTEVSIEFGDRGDDHDVAELFAYTDINETGDLLGFVSGEMGNDRMDRDGPFVLTYVAPEGESFQSIKFRAGIEPYRQSAYIDNIVTKVVPSPGTLAMLGLACAAGAGALRRRDAN